MKLFWLIIWNILILFLLKIENYFFYYYKWMGFVSINILKGRYIMFKVFNV